VSFTQTSWTLYVNGGAVRTASGTCNLANTGYWLCAGGYADRLGSAGYCNVLIAHLAVYGYQLPQSRVVSHFQSAVAAMAGQDTSGQRADRLLGDGNCAFPRIMPAGADTFTGAMDIAGQAVSQNLVNVAESDSSWLMADSPGYLFLQDRRGGYNLPVLWTFGELQASPLNQNYQFNGTIAPWTGFDNATVSYSAAWSYGGQGALLITPDGVTSQPFAGSEQVPVTPGTTYTATAWVYSPQGWSSAGVNIDWFTSGAVYISTSAAGGQVLPAATPMQVATAARAPATAAYGRVSVVMGGTPAATVLLYAGYAALTGPTEYAYLGDIATDCDPSILYNDVTQTQLAAPSVSSTTLSAAVTAGAASVTVASAAGILAGGVLILGTGTASGELVTVTTVSGNTVGITAAAYAHSSGATVTVVNAQASGVTVTAVNAPSVTAYGDQTLQQTSYLTDPAAITDQAQWIVNALGTPANRIAVMTLDPAANPVLWPVVLGIETGQCVQVNRRLAGTQTEISGQYQVMSVAHSSAPRSWTCRLSLLPYLGQVLACDDVTHGIPGTLNCLGWLAGHGEAS
jgi:hypothetical protein